MSWTKAKRFLVAIALAGMPLTMMASCDPYDGSLSVFRDRDHGHHGFFDLFLDDVHFDGCFFIDCHYDDDYYYDEIVIFD